MWNGYCGDLIRRANRNLLIVLVCIAAAGALLLYYQRQYLTQFFRGAASVDVTEVALHPVANRFVRIHIDRALDTGIQHTTTDNGATRVDSQYFITLAGDKLLVLRIPGGGNPDEIQNLTFEGRLRPLTTELNEHLKNSLNRPDLPPLAAYYVDGQDYRGLGIAFLVIGIPVLLFWSWMLWRYLQVSGDFARHGFAKKIAQYGQLEMLVHEIDSEMAGAHTTYSRRSNAVEITQNWFLTRTPFGGDAIRLNHLTWAYQYLLKRKLYFFITVGKNYFVHAYDDLGKKTQIQLSQDKVAAVLRELASRVPGAIFGYNKSLDKLWKTSRKQPSGFFEQARVLAGQVQLMPERIGNARYR